MYINTKDQIEVLTDVLNGGTMNIRNYRNDFHKRRKREGSQ